MRDGDPAAVTLPIRPSSTLRAGLPRRRGFGPQRPGPLRELPAHLGQAQHAVGLLGGVRAVGGAVAHPADDALQDARQAEGVVGAEPVEVVQARAAGQAAVVRRPPPRWSARRAPSCPRSAEIAPLTQFIRR